MDRKTTGLVNILVYELGWNKVVWNPAASGGKKALERGEGIAGGSNTPVQCASCLPHQGMTISQ